MADPFIDLLSDCQVYSHLREGIKGKGKLGSTDLAALIQGKELYKEIIKKHWFMCNTTVYLHAFHFIAIL